MPYNLPRVPQLPEGRSLNTPTLPGPRPGVELSQGSFVIS